MLNTPRKIIVREAPKEAKVLHSNSLLNYIYAARGVKDLGELDYDLSRLLPYELLKGIDRAVECLVDAIKDQQHVLVVGDFDVDGATSTALAVLALKSFGFKNVSYLILSRFDLEHGLTADAVTTISSTDNPPQVIITVDHGISSIDGVKKANELGIKVVITDHHIPGANLPQAYAIINPNQPHDNFPSKNLAGVGVVFYLMLGLRGCLRKLGWFSKDTGGINEPNMAQFLDLVALGTIADVVSLDHNNRILVAQGIKRIRLGKCRLGIKELLVITKRKYENILAADLGFVIAPRLNAVGRLDDMSLGVECLLTEDIEQARFLAKKLDMLNNERRNIEFDMQKQALRLLHTIQLEQELPYGLCIFEETWHQGILGILASRLKDKLRRPVIVFTVMDNDQIKGSARSTPNIHICKILNDISLKNPGLVTRFGGHAMAAGLSMPRDNYSVFAELFAKEVEDVVRSSNSHDVFYTDGQLSAEYIVLEIAELLRSAGPWGQGFPEPIFFGDFVLANQRLVGQKHLKLTLRLPESNNEIDAICFNINPDFWPNFRCSKIKIIYRLDVNEYRQRRNLQLMIEEIISYE